MVKLTKIYTRTGDGGTTGLVDGSRVAKDAAVMQAIGDVDEANSALGVAIAALVHHPDTTHVLNIRDRVVDVGVRLDSEAPTDSALRT
ncbi:ATP:cob(I)alamin adenosyltransferase, partial [Sphingomonas sp. ABOLH]